MGSRGDVVSGSLRLRLGAERWGLASRGDQAILPRRVVPSLAATACNPPLKPFVEERAALCPAPLPSAGTGLPLLQSVSLEAPQGVCSLLPCSWPAQKDEGLRVLGALAAIWDSSSLTVFLALSSSRQGSGILSGPHQLLASAAGLRLREAGGGGRGGASGIACGSLVPPGGLDLFGFWGGMGAHIGFGLSFS